MKRGFKTYARKLALEIRAELGLTAFVRFDPYELAGEYGIPVYELSDLGRDNGAQNAARHFGSDHSAVFSAALVPVGSGMFIIDNDHQTSTRRRSSVSHEMSHLLLEHAFDEVLVTADGCRSYDKDKEDEATWLAGELLVPYEAAERAAWEDLSNEDVAGQFDVSIRMAAMRMNFSGARKVVALQRAHGLCGSRLPGISNTAACPCHGTLLQPGITGTDHSACARNSLSASATANG